MGPPASLSTMAGWPPRAPSCSVTVQGPPGVLGGATGLGRHKCGALNPAQARVHKASPFWEDSPQRICSAISEINLIFRSPALKWLCNTHTDAHVFHREHDWFFFCTNPRSVKIALRLNPLAKSAPNMLWRVIFNPVLHAMRIGGCNCRGVVHPTTWAMVLSLNPSVELVGKHATLKGLFHGWQSEKLRFCPPPPAVLAAFRW